eukprot:COSAG06_NODE_608_length_13862_cov_86.760355_8_plen_166_part_00
MAQKVRFPYLFAPPPPLRPLDETTRYTPREKTGSQHGHTRSNRSTTKQQQQQQQRQQRWRAARAPKSQAIIRIAPRLEPVGEQQQLHAPPVVSTNNLPPRMDLIWEQLHAPPRRRRLEIACGFAETLSVRSCDEPHRSNLEKDTSFCLSTLPYVCPEPALVKRSI